MAKIPVEIISLIKRFIIEADKFNIKIEKAVLFGSYARGNSNDYSDIDLAVVSSSFDGNRFYDNLKLSRPKLNISSLLETHPFRPEDFNEDNPFAKEILETGIAVY